MTKEDLIIFGEKKLNELRETERIIKGLIKDTLKEIGHPVIFNWQESDAPSYASGQFDEDLVDAYVSKIWLEDDFVYVNLHAYYLGEDIEKLLLDDDYCVDYADILQFLLLYLTEQDC